MQPKPADHSHDQVGNKEKNLPAASDNLYSDAYDVQRQGPARNSLSNLTDRSSKLLAMADPPDSPPVPDSPPAPDSPPPPAVTDRGEGVIHDLRSQISKDPNRVYEFINQFVDNTYRDVEKLLSSNGKTSTLNLGNDLRTAEQLEKMGKVTLTPEMRLSSSIYKLVGLDQEGFVRELNRRINVNGAKLNIDDHKQLNQLIYDNLKDRFTPPVDEHTYKVVSRQLNVSPEDVRQLHSRYLRAGSALGLLSPEEKLTKTVSPKAAVPKPLVTITPPRARTSPPKVVATPPPPLPAEKVARTKADKPTSVAKTSEPKPEAKPEPTKESEPKKETVPTKIAQVEKKEALPSAIKKEETPKKVDDADNSNTARETNHATRDVLILGGGGLAAVGAGYGTYRLLHNHFLRNRRTTETVTRDSGPTREPAEGLSPENPVPIGGSEAEQYALRGQGPPPAELPHPFAPISHPGPIAPIPPESLVPAPGELAPPPEPAERPKPTPQLSNVELDNLITTIASMEPDEAARLTVKHAVIGAVESCRKDKVDLRQPVAAQELRARLHAGLGQVYEHLLSEQFGDEPSQVPDDVLWRCTQTCFDGMGSINDAKTFEGFLKAMSSLPGKLAIDPETYTVTDLGEAELIPKPGIAAAAPPHEPVSRRAAAEGAAVVNGNSPEPVAPPTNTLIETDVLEARRGLTLTSNLTDRTLVAQYIRNSALGEAKELCRKDGLNLNDQSSLDRFKQYSYERIKAIEEAIEKWPIEEDYKAVHRQFCSQLRTTIEQTNTSPAEILANSRFRDLPKNDFALLSVIANAEKTQNDKTPTGATPDLTIIEKITEREVFTRAVKLCERAGVDLTSESSRAKFINHLRLRSSELEEYFDISETRESYGKASLKPESLDNCIKHVKRTINAIEGNPEYRTPLDIIIAFKHEATLPLPLARSTAPVQAPTEQPVAAHAAPTPTRQTAPAVTAGLAAPPVGPVHARETAPREAAEEPAIENELAEADADAELLKELSLKRAGQEEQARVYVEQELLTRAIKVMAQEFPDFPNISPDQDAEDINEKWRLVLGGTSSELERTIQFTHQNINPGIQDAAREESCEVWVRYTNHAGEDPRTSVANFLTARVQDRGFALPGIGTVVATSPSGTTGDASTTTIDRTAPPSPSEPITPVPETSAALEPAPATARTTAPTEAPPAAETPAPPTRPEAAREAVKVDVLRITRPGEALSVAEKYDARAGALAFRQLLLQRTLDACSAQEIDINASPETRAPGIKQKVLNILSDEAATMDIAIGNLTRSVGANRSETAQNLMDELGRTLNHDITPVREHLSNYSVARCLELAGYQKDTKPFYVPQVEPGRVDHRDLMRQELDGETDPENPDDPLAKYANELKEALTASAKEKSVKEELHTSPQQREKFKEKLWSHTLGEAEYFKASGKQQYLEYLRQQVIPSLTTNEDREIFIQLADQYETDSSNVSPADFLLSRIDPIHEEREKLLLNAVGDTDVDETEDGEPKSREEIIKDARNEMLSILQRDADQYKPKVLLELREWAAALPQNAQEALTAYERLSAANPVLHKPRAHKTTLDILGTLHESLPSEELPKAKGVHLKRADSNNPTPEESGPIQGETALNLDSLGQARERVSVGAPDLLAGLAPGNEANVPAAAQEVAQEHQTGQASTEKAANPARTAVTTDQSMKQGPFTPDEIDAALRALETEKARVQREEGSGEAEALTRALDKMTKDRKRATTEADYARLAKGIGREHPGLLESIRKGGGVAGSIGGAMVLFGAALDYFRKGK